MIIRSEFGELRREIGTIDITNGSFVETHPAWKAYYLNDAPITEERYNEILEDWQDNLYDLSFSDD